jgi:hypothetical protein
MRGSPDAARGSILRATHRSPHLDPNAAMQRFTYSLDDLLAKLGAARLHARFPR